MTASSPLARYLQKQPDFKDPSSSSSPLPALYADLAAHRSSNRSSYEASVEWWARLLSQACLAGVQDASTSTSRKGKEAESRDGDRLVLHLDQHLIEECTIDEVGRPLGLGTVAVSAIEEGPEAIELIPTSCRWSYNLQRGCTQSGSFCLLQQDFLGQAHRSDVYHRQPIALQQYHWLGLSRSFL
jgi:hypothetical protein